MPRPRVRKIPYAGGLFRAAGRAVHYLLNNSQVLFVVLWITKVFRMLLCVWTFGVDDQTYAYLKDTLLEAISPLLYVPLWGNLIHT